MGKFKVGDRVRVVDDSGSPGLYKVGEICVVAEIDEDDDFVHGDYILVEGKDSGMYSSRFELLPVAEQPAAWQPKVGDRVRFVEEYGHAKAGDEGTVTGFWSDGIEVDVKGTAHSCYTHRVEPLPVAAEAQPAAWVPAVGDKVRCTVGLGDAVISSVRDDGKFLVRWKNQDTPGSVYWGVDDWVLIEAAQPTASNDNAPTVAPQQPASTAGFTIPVFDDEPANDNPLTVTLSLDADDLHEELDEIIAKLKKIRKLQRQVGLAA
jgi:hypothetical protein